MNEEFLEESYARQFIMGCDSINCDNIMCASCQNYILAAKSVDEKLQFAHHCAYMPNERPLLCPSLTNVMLSKESLEKHKDLQLFIRDYLDGKEITQRKVTKEIRPFLSNLKLFSTMLLKNNKPISYFNSNISDKLMDAFSNKIASDPLLNPALLDCIAILANEILQSDFSTYTSLRAYILILYFPEVCAPQCTDKLLDPLLRQFSNFSQPQLKIIRNWIIKMPRLLRQIVGYTHFSISMYFATKVKPKIHGTFINEMCFLLSMLHDANSKSFNPLGPVFFYNSHLDEAIDPATELTYSHNNRMSLLSFPCVLSIKTKAAICQIESQHLMGAIAMHSLIFGSLNSRNYNDLFLTLHIRRAHLLDDAVAQLTAQNMLSFLKKLRVIFEGESAVDVGGPSREFLYLIAERLFSPDLGMFIVVQGRYNWFSQCTFEGDRSFFLVGAVVGLAVHNNIVLPIRFPLVVYKRLLTPDEELTLHDLSEIDPEIVNSMKNIRKMAERNEDISQLYLTFDATIDCFGEKVNVPIAEGMGGLEVDNNNYQLYIRAYIHFILVKSIEKQFLSFRRGFELACRAPSYKLLGPEELDILVSGEEVMDWGALQRCATYTDGYTKSSRAVRWFWDIFSKLSNSDKLKFLKFATGTDRAPLGGLGNVKLVLQRGADPNRLPVSHTCFNTFTLPDYRNKRIMEERIMLAIQHTEGFGIV